MIGKTGKLLSWKIFLKDLKWSRLAEWTKASNGRGIPLLLSITRILWVGEDVGSNPTAASFFQKIRIFFY